MATEPTLVELRLDPQAPFADLPIRPASAQMRQASTDKWNAVGKPIGSLGQLEETVTRIAALTESLSVHVDNPLVIPMCADNGVVAEGVTQATQDITTAVAEAMAQGFSSVCKMGGVYGIGVRPVDAGMVKPGKGVIDHRAAAGTANMTQGPAMTREQALTAIQGGIDEAACAIREGHDVLITGEMGIGNTTTSSALAAVLLGLPVEEVTGRGAGLSDEGMLRKIDAIKRAIAVNQPDPADAFDCLCKVGGFDIAGMVGVYLGGAANRVPVVIDGFISAVAALVAARLCPAAKDAMLASHMSDEPAAKMVFQELGLNPIIRAQMRLGEGTGAVLMIPIIRMALALYEGSSFDEYGMDAYDEEVDDDRELYGLKA